MAYRRSRGKARRKIQPSPMVLDFRLPAVSVASDGPGIVPGTSEAYLDLSQVVSLVSRRFYRQGLLWAVAGIKFTSQSTTGGVHYDSAPVGSVEISKLPETWVMSNSWEKGFRAWQKMNDEALEESESVRPKFLDFKIYADDGHHDAGFTANLMPTSAKPITAVPGEWISSEMQIPTGTAGTHGQTASREIIAVGGNYPGLSTATGLDAVSLIEGYAASRALPNIRDPNTPTDADDVDGFNPDNWLAATFNEGTRQAEQVLDDMLASNNQAPYPFENDGIHTDTMYPNGANQLSGLQVHDFELITGSTIGGTTRLSGGAFPCGLMKISAANYNPTHELSLRMQITLVPGPHRGYMAGPMQEM